MKPIQHIIATAIVSIIILLVFAAVQQTYRTAANDPQVQLLSDLKTKLEAGKTIDSYFIGDTIDLQKSLSVFIETYDKEGKPIQSSGLIDNKLPVLPLGVINMAKLNNENWVTWQPQLGIRLAIGIEKVNASPVAFVVAGRSLKEVENRTSQLRKMIIIAWATCLLIITLHYIFHSYFRIGKKLAVPHEEQTKY